MAAGDNTPITDANFVNENIATNVLSTLNGGDVTGVNPLIKVQRMKPGYGSDGDLTDVDLTHGLPVNIVSSIARSDTGDSVSAALQVNKVMFGLTEIVPGHNFLNVAASSTDSVLVAGVTNKKVYVLSAVFVVGATATTAVFNSKPAGAGTAISPSFANGVNGGAVLPFNPAGWFVSNTGEGLSVTTGAGSTTGVAIAYAQN